MPLFNNTPPPAPNDGDPYDPLREAAHVRSGDDTQTVLENLINTLRHFPPTPLTDDSTGLRYLVLAQTAGSTTAAATIALRAFLTQDQSAGGANGLISVTPGVVVDLPNSGTTWGTTGFDISIDDPVYGSVPFNVPVLVGSGPATRMPQLQLDPSATCDYLHASIDSTTGFITAMAIEADSGSGLPASTDSDWYYLLSDLTVTIVSSVATVTLLNDGAQSSLNFAICNPGTSLPLTDGSSYRVGT